MAKSSFGWSPHYLAKSQKFIKKIKIVAYKMSEAISAYIFKDEI
jgi:hypothetical protein